ncbi:MAG: hypothetical protein KY476_05110 [Planctomycetes bacterium]|nr:hypothetical protein [Planctomycetota bacterium]
MERQAWLNEKLLLQRDTIKRERDDRFPSWESQFETWELDKFMKAATWYIVCEIRPITPLPLPRLRKLKGDHPLAANYTRGYALCHYPMTEIQVIQEKPLRVVGPPDPSPPKRDLPAPKPPPEVPKPGHRPEPPDPQPHPTQPPRTDPPETQPPPVRA